MTGRPRFLDAGEAALVVEFGSTVDAAINDRVLALDAALGAAPANGIVELVPTYRSLMIHYDPLILDRANLIALVETALAGIGDAPAVAARTWLLPCCYDGAHGEDLAELAAILGLSPEQAVALHAASESRVYMCGFAPGYAYLGDIPPELALSRRATPRPPHPPGAILLGGGLGAVAGFAMPTGWYVIGQTPERIYRPDRAEPFLLRAGDRVRFERIDAAAFAALEVRAEAGEPIARRVG